MAVWQETSYLFRIANFFRSVWTNSSIYLKLNRLYHVLVNALSSSALARIFSPYNPREIPGLGEILFRKARTWGETALQKSLQWLRKTFLRGSIISREFHNFLLDWRGSTVNVLGEILFGFSGSFLSLSLYFHRLEGLSWIFFGTLCMVLGLIGTLAPTEFLRSSLLQKFREKPYEKRRGFILPILIGIFAGFFAFLSTPLLVLGGTIALLVSFLIVFKEEWGLYVIAAYAPVDFFVRSNLPSGVARIWPLALMALVLLGIIFRTWKNPPRRFFFTEVSPPLLFFLMWNSLSLLENSVSFSVGFEGIRAILQTSIFFFLTLNALRKRDRLKTLLLILSIILLGVSLYAIYQHIIQVPVKPGWVDVDFEQDIKTRSYSIFPSPNALSGYLVLFFPLLLVLFLEERKIILKIFFLGVALLMGLALMYTLTRAGWLVCGLSLLLLGILHDRRILVFLLILALALPFLPEFSTRLSTMISGEYWAKSATAGRLYRWELGLEIASGHPLFGTGPGTFGGAVAYRAGYWPGIYADNYYIKTASELGFAGLSLFLLTLLFLFVGGFRRIRTIKEKTLKNIGWALQAGIFAFLAHNFTENLWEEPPLAVAFWFTAGLLFLLPLLEKGNVSET
ncbi:MAG: O-antigen ligase family protein [Caldiserica bacterium]|jgi:O-antigen ligase|nr:O-antigen ligase family protein [Caldisericota bacterium]MDH7563091.1 O-antigen ligase family protein [Caldisericota bacterium]